LPEGEGTMPVPGWPPRPMPTPQWRPPRRPTPTARTRSSDAAAGPAAGWTPAQGGRVTRRRPRLVLLAGALLVVAVVAVVAVTARGRDVAPTARADRPTATSAAGSATAAMVRTGRGFRLQVPADWQDRTPELGRRVARAPAELVLTGRTAGGFAATITVIRAEDTSRLAPLAQVRGLVAAEVARLKGAQLLGRPTTTVLEGTAGLAYEFTFISGGGQVNGRQVVVDHDGDRYFLTAEARPAGFAQTAAAFEWVLRTWRWD
jgi:hypothetical protein